MTVSESVSTPRSRATSRRQTGDTTAADSTQVRDLACVTVFGSEREARRTLAGNVNAPRERILDEPCNGSYIRYNMPSEEPKTIVVRLPADLVERADALIARIVERRSRSDVVRQSGEPAPAPTRASVLRLALAAGLAAVEADEQDFG